MIQNEFQIICGQLLAAWGCYVQELLERRTTKLTNNQEFTIELQFVNSCVHSATAKVKLFLCCDMVPLWLTNE